MFMLSFFRYLERFSRKLSTTDQGSSSNLKERIFRQCEEKIYFLLNQYKYGSSSDPKSIFFINSKFIHGTVGECQRETQKPNVPRLEITI